MKVLTSFLLVVALIATVVILLRMPNEEPPLRGNYDGTAQAPNLGSVAPTAE